jgi:flagella basal body P-ring formation protein FlgA
MQILFLLMTPLLIGAETSCIQVSGDKIHAGDLAKHVDAFRSINANVEIGFAPLPGGRRTITAGELQRIAAKNGIKETIQSDLCVQLQTRPLQPQELKQAIELELQNQGITNATVEVLDFSHYEVPEGRLEFTKSGLTPPAEKNSALPVVLWRGRMVYGGSRSVALWARARVFVNADIPIAARNIPAATALGDDDVKVENRPVFPFGLTPLAQVRDVGGKRTRRALKKGDPIMAAVLETPKDVERGDKVEVAVDSGSARLRLDALAESAGRIGDHILVKNLGSGKRFQAKVESKGHVKVIASVEEKE